MFIAEKPQLTWVEAEVSAYNWNIHLVCIWLHGTNQCPEKNQRGTNRGSMVPLILGNGKPVIGLLHYFIFKQEIIV